jgi:hypothetical protein
VGEEDVAVNEGLGFVGKLLETEDDGVLWGIFPRASRHHLTASIGVVLVLGTSGGGFFDHNSVACSNQLSSLLRQKRCAAFERLDFVSQPKAKGSHRSKNMEEEKKIEGRKN